MAFSSLISKEILSPNYNVRSNSYYNPSGKILKITPHHAAFIGTAEQIANTFASESRQASANYCIGNDGEIVGCVSESNRAWTSGSPENDYYAVTLEISNSVSGEPWTVSEEAWNATVNLCVDICQRNGIKKLTFTGDKSGNLTAHRMFQATACPGTYLYSKFPELAETVNKILNGEEEEDEEPMTAEEKKAFEKLQNDFNKLKKDYDSHTKVKYAYVDKNMPEWAREPITDMYEKGYLQGDENGKLNLSDDDLRQYTVMDRIDKAHTK